VLACGPRFAPTWATTEWDALVDREVAPQGQIEAAFDRADASESAGDFALALDWLDRASELSGGLSRACLAQRVRLVRAGVLVCAP
jgi:hypothetical protein